MNNINQVPEKVTGQKTFWSRFVYPVALFSLLNFANINEMQGQSKESNNRTNTELSTEEFVSQLDKKLWVTLPSGYDSKVRNFVQNNYVMQNNNARVFTQNFIVDEMKKNWWISKQNQLLFIRYSIYLNIEKKDLYDWDDWDEKRLEEFEMALDFVENCWKQYINNLNIYIKQCTESANKKADESIRHIMSLDSAWLKSLNNIYNLYKKDPSSVTAWELEQARKSAAHIISDCKKYGIDYKKLLAPEVRKFYGIE